MSEPSFEPTSKQSDGGWWRNAWNKTKKWYGTTSKVLSDNSGLVSVGTGLAAAYLSGDPQVGLKAAKGTQMIIDTNDKIRNLVSDSPDGNVKDALKSAVPEMTAKTNQYRSPHAISAPGEGVVYGQNTVPVFRKRQNFPDGITVNVAAPNRYVRRRRPKQVRVKRSHPKQARKVVKRKVRRH